MSIDIEDLNKSQIILLTLLVSFVTSIATGIVTVSLMERAPKDVVRVVQRVVERTVEKIDTVTPDASNKDNSPQVVVQEKTIIVKEGDLLSEAVAKTKNTVLKIYNKDTDEFIAYGIPVGPKSLATDASALEKDMQYIVKTGDDFRDITLFKEGGVRGLSIYKVDGDIEFKQVKITSTQPKLGEKVFLFTSKDFSSISTGIISSVSNGVFTVDIKRKNMPGTPVFSTSGTVLGISTSVSRKESQGSFTPANYALMLFKGMEDKNQNTVGEDTKNATSTTADNSGKNTASVENSGI